MTLFKFDVCSKALGLLRLLLILLVFQLVALEARAGNFITYGPEDFAGKTINTKTFSVLNPSAAYKLLINNGGANAQFTRVVSSGLVKLNGTEVVSPSDFNQNVKVIEKPITLLPNNTLIIDLSSNADSGITLQIIGDDTDKPAIEATVSPQANVAGWHKGNATVSFTCTDKTSKITACTSPITVTIEGAGQTVQGTANDQGGNTASTSVTISLDKTPPIVTPNIQPLANGAGWHKADATVSFDCADNFMGITFCTPPITITTEGAGQTVQGTAQDRADNMTTASAKVSLDKTPPLVTITSPADGASIDGKTAHVVGTVADALSGVTSVGCNGVDATVSGSVFNCEIPLQNGANTLTAQATDVAGNSSSSGINVTMSNAEIKILEPANFSFFNINTVTVSGTVAAGSTGVTVNGIPATLSAGNWSASIPLQEGNNTLTAVAVKTGGAVNTASIQVTLDTTPPRVTVAAPIDGFKTTEDHITVTGIVNDIVVGTVNSGQAQVTVNNIAAQVANRTYTAADIPLQTGLNTIQVIGRDQVGNSATATVKVTREAVSAPFIKLLSGNNQTGAIATALAEPLVVQLLNGETPVANTPVIFKITENDGYLQLTNGRKLQLIAVNTDAEGKAQAMLTLGNRAGAGNNIVEAYATGYQGTALFTASGTPAAVANINVDAGANQFGAINNTLPLPFVAVVTDAGHNRLGGVPVTFTVTQGGGNINGQASYETVSDSDGRVLAVLSLGPEAGQDNNVVEAGFPGNSGFAAAFSASGKMPGDPAQTAISGIVQDNSNNPIPGVTMRLLQLHLGSSNNQPVEVATPTVTDANGQFKLAPAPVGFFKLMADGATAIETDKRYPALEYDIVTVAGQDNGVGMPIYLPALDPDAKLCVDAQTGGTLKMASSPGFSLTLAPGAATFPGGSKSGCVSVTPVNPDKVPMVPGFGQQPRYVVTIQPVGTTFSPPAAITIPNMDGLAPHAKTEMYSYDHDLAAFVAIGSGTVSADGSVIASDPGIGVMKAGWHCGGNPNIPGSAGHCPTCRKCDGSDCVVNDGDPRIAESNKKGDCKKPICSNGVSQDLDDNSDIPDDKCKKCKEGQAIDIDLGIIKINKIARSNIIRAGTDGTINECPTKTPAPVSFEAKVDGGDSCTRTYLWDFGDGKSSYIQNPTNDYEKAGTFTAKVEMMCDGCSKSVSSSVDVTIEEGKTLDKIKEDYQSMISGAQAFGWNVAANNLQHFIDATGTPLTISSSWLTEFSSVSDAADVNLGRFEIISIPSAIASLPSGGSVTITDYWDRLVLVGNTEFELFYASGDSTVTSTGTFTLTKSESGEVSITGSVTHNWHDPYDWHAGLSAPVPGFGDVSDDDALCLIAAGMAKEFDMASSWTQNLTYNSGVYSWSKP